jgi:hypothetical protein
VCACVCVCVMYEVWYMVYDETTWPHSRTTLLLLRSFNDVARPSSSIDAELGKRRLTAACWMG